VGTRDISVADETELPALLAAGGLTSASPDAGNSNASYDPLRDPVGATELASVLALRAGPLTPDVVVVWSEPADAVLGFLVARELGLPVVRTWDNDGLVVFDRELGPLSRALVVDAVPDQGRILAIRALLNQHHGLLVGVASLVRGDVPTGVDEVALVSDLAGEP
jgi:hypothetical protein